MKQKKYFSEIYPERLYKVVRKYIEKRALLEEINDVLMLRLYLTIRSRGQYCERCHIIQGEPSNGFSAYYCRHLNVRISQQLKKENEKILRKELAWFKVYSPALSNSG
jgi:hypothetical protein